MFATILVTGKVQGVGFRNFVRVIGKYGNVKGIVRNLNNGSVEIFADANEEDIKKLVAKLKTGKPNAQVQNVIVHEEGSEEYRGPWKEYKDRLVIDSKWSD